jgi:hypothetical protein
MQKNTESAQVGITASHSPFHASFPSFTYELELRDAVPLMQRSLSVFLRLPVTTQPAHTNTRT